MYSPLAYGQEPGGPFDPLAWFNVAGEIGCVCWLLAYVFIIRQCFRDRSYGLPLVAICMNVAWEFLASWVFPNPVGLWRFFDRVWFFTDLIIVFQLIRYGRPLQKIKEVQRHFIAVIVGTTALSGVGLYAFYVQYRDLLGLMGAFMINLVMSVTFVFFCFARARQGGRGLSLPAAWLKMLGTLGTSIECHPVIGMTQPGLGGLHFLTFLCVAIFLFDGLYIYAVTRVVRGLEQSKGAGRGPPPQGPADAWAFTAKESRKIGLAPTRVGQRPGNGVLGDAVEKPVSGGGVG